MSKNPTSQFEKWGFMISVHGYHLYWVSALWVQMIHYQQIPFSVKLFGEAIWNTTQKRKL
jgi:hypothetical protein